jgi:DNA-binding NtrC family response regulator
MTEAKSKSERAEVHAALEAIVGVSDWIQTIRGMVATVAPYSSSVMITGPSGTGKELIARAVHALSRRADKRFIPVDCAANTGTLFASHMFGHVKGAFTGATHDALGCFRAADGGTIFLDEIGVLPPDLQVKLLRVLQERQVVPVGGHDGIPVDVRVVAATNRDLHKEAAAGRFREDLFYRLHVVALHTLPLEERPEDIEPLARHFLAKLAVENGMPRKRLSAAAVKKILRMDWPGNVRQLENTLERAVLFAPSDVIGLESITGEDVRETSVARTISRLLATSGTISSGHWSTLAEVEREHIRRTLERAKHNQSLAARLLDVDRHYLRRRMADYGLESHSAKRVHPAPKLASFRAA